MTDESFPRRLEVLELAFLARQPDAMREAKFIEHTLKSHRERVEKRLAIVAKARRCGVSALQDTLEQIDNMLASLKALVDRHIHRNLNRDMTNHPGQTPEARLQGRHQGSVRRLWERGHLTERHVATAVRIASTFEGITRACSMRARVLDGSMGGGARYRGFDDLRFSEWLAMVYSDVYRPWARACTEEGIPTSFIVDVVVYDMALDQARRLQGWGYERGLKMLRKGLELFLEQTEAVNIYWELSRA